jgi:carboxyl-terminal processing protease
MITSYLSSFYFNSINNFAFEYVDNNRKKLSKWTVNSFITDFDKDNTVLNSYLTNIKRWAKLSAESQESIKKYLKASIASALFGDIGFYKIIHEDDKMLQKVLELESKKE